MAIFCGMDLLQCFMMLCTAHSLAFFYFSSFKREKSLVRLAVELIVYVIVSALAFSPVLDGNNYLYLLTVILFHLLTSPLVRLAGKRSERAHLITFTAVEVLRLALFAGLSFLHSVRWGQFEPWREVRFFLLQFDLSFNEVLAWAFALTLAIRPANILVKKVLGAVDEEEETGRHISGALVGIVERLLYLASLFYGSWLAFAFIHFAKSTLFCLAIRNDVDRGMRLYMGSLVSALSVIPLALIARPFF